MILGIKKRENISSITVYISIFDLLRTYTFIPGVLCEVNIAAAEYINNVAMYSIWNAEVWECHCGQMSINSLICIYSIANGQQQQSIAGRKRRCGQLQRFDCLGFAHFTQ